MRTYWNTNSTLKTISDWQPNCWIQVTCPTEEDQEYLEDKFNIPDYFLSDISDTDERARYEYDDGWMLIILRIPYVKEIRSRTPYTTVPLGIIHKRDVTITVCYYETNMMIDFVSYQQKRGVGFTDYVDMIFRLFLSSAVASPAIIGCIVLIAVLTAFWSLFECSVLLHGLDLARKGENIRLPALLCTSLLDACHAFLPQNWLILVYSATLIPFTNFFLAVNYITQLAVPEYIMGVIRANSRYHLLYLALCAALLVLLISWVLVLPLFLLEHKSLWQSVRESVSYVRTRILRTFLLLLRWNVSALLRSLLLTAAIALPLYGIIICIGMQSTQAMFALSRAALTIELPFFQFLIDCTITLAQCTVITALYDRLRGSLSFEAEADPDRRPCRSNGRLLLTAAIAGATLLTFVLAACYFVLPEDDALRSMLGGTVPIVTAHRGYSAAAPENTLPAFQLAIDHGCERAELDVQMTKDGIVMVTHDANLRRCAGRNENIYDLTYDEVRRLDAGRWFGQKYTGTRIPTLEEVLDQCKGRIQLNIEIKPNAATPDLEAETIRIIYEKGFEHDCVITSQSYDTLCKVNELAPEIQTGYILALGVGSYYDLPAADFFSVESTFITPGMVQQIHLRGKTISAWTVNRQEDASDLLSLGVDDIITDKPEMVQQLMNADADLDSDLLFIRDTIRSLIGWFDAEDEPTPEEEVIEEAIEDPEELLDAA